MKRAPAPAIKQAAPPPTPPPPNEEPPKPATEAPPVFGVTMSSVVSGPGPGMAVPVGNTLMTKPGKVAKPGDAQPYAGEGTRPFTPVADIYISKYPQIVREVNGEDVYPPDAKRMEIEGKVVLKIGIDERGNVVQVKVVERAGHGFDEAAVKAMRESKFTPAIANDGRPVPYQLTWTFRFDLTR
jgi:protein TonB